MFARRFVNLWVAIGLVMPELARAQPVTLPKPLPELFHYVSAEERSTLPEPQKWNPIYWSWPEYKRTPHVCVRDSVLDNYITGKIEWRNKLPLEFNLVSLGFISIDVNGNDVQEILLSSEQSSFLRRYMFSTLQSVGQGGGALGWLLWAAGAPVPSKLLAAIPELTAVAAAVWIVSGFALYVDENAHPYKEGVASLAEHLGEGALIYRVLTLITEGKRRYARVSYALYTKDKNLFVLSRCYYAQHVH